LKRRLAAEFSISQRLAVRNVVRAVALELRRESLREQAGRMHRMREDESPVVIGCRVDAGLVESTGEKGRVDLVVVRVTETERCSELLGEFEVRVAVGGHASVPQAGDAEGGCIAVWIRDVVPVVPGRRPGGRQNSGSDGMRAGETVGTEAYVLRE